jgi:hypothetical protein
MKHEEHGHARQGLAEERGVVGGDVGSVRRPVCGVDPQRPGQGAGCAVQFLVEVVAEPADGLSEHQTGSDGIGECREPDAGPFASDPRAERSQRDRSPDAEPAVPDVEGSDGFPAGGEVQLGVGDHVVEASADYPERHRPHGHIQHVTDPPTRAVQRFRVTSTATTIPARMHNA